MLWGFLPAWCLVPRAPAADIGTAFTYQGRLEKPAGTALTDTCDLRFGLWDTAAGGSQVGTSPRTVPDVGVVEGVFTVAIDFGPGAFDGSARWLAVEVQCTADAGFVALTPRVELKPAPHALRAVEAAALEIPYLSTQSTSDAMIELTQTGDGPTAIFKVQPQPEPPLPQPAVEAISSSGAPAIKGSNTTGNGPAACFESTAAPTLPLPPPTVMAMNNSPAPTVEVTNIGSGSAVMATSGMPGVSSAPAVSTLHAGIGTAVLAVATAGTAIHGISSGGLAGYFEGGVEVTGGMGCTSLVWGSSALGADQGGAIELGDSLSMSSGPYIDLHRGVGAAEDFNVRLINDADQQLSLEGNLRVTGNLTKAYSAGTSNLAVPVAYATVTDLGAVAAGTPNVSVAWELANQRYVITLAGESYTSTGYVTTVTPITTAAPEALFATTGSGSGQLRIRIMSASTGTTGLQRPFQFVTYKP
jgi:hypothetical protein